MNKLQIQIKDAEHWKQVRDENESKLIVANVFKPWCGSCTVMEPTCKQLLNDLEDSSERLLFVAVPSDLEIEELEKPESCKPLYVLYLGAKKVGNVVGANAPQLVSLVKQFVPEVPSPEGTTA